MKRVFGQIVDAVEYCHKKGLYHRDLKPDNILTSEDGRSIWLADFGLATVDKKCKEFRTGTLPYLSPGASLLNRFPSCRSFGNVRFFVQNVYRRPSVP